MTITIKDEFIKLGQALKLADFVSDGGTAKTVITSGLVTVNGETDTRRGRKLYSGDTFTYQGQTCEVISTLTDRQSIQDDYTSYT